MKRIKAWDSVYLGFNVRPFYKWRLYAKKSYYDELGVTDWFIQVGPFSVFGGI